MSLWLSALIQNDQGWTHIFEIFGPFPPSCDSYLYAFGLRPVKVSREAARLETFKDVDRGIVQKEEPSLPGGSQLPASDRKPLGQSQPCHRASRLHRGWL